MTQSGPITTIVKSISQNHKEIIKAHQAKKKHMVSLPEVQEKLTPKERVLTDAATQTAISQISDFELITKLKALIPIVARDIGFSKWNNPEEMQYIGTRFLEITKKYYSDLTLREIKVSFELLAVGELDKFLPKRDGKADRNHYQNFSVDYYTTVLNAYKERKAEVWGKVHQLIPAISITTTTDQRKQYHDSFINTVCEVFDAYKNELIPPRFIAPSMVIKLLIKAELLPEDLKPTEKQLEHALYLTITSVNKFQAAHIGEDHKHKEVEKRATRLAQESNIIAVFDKLIKEKQHIKNYIS